MELGSFLPLTLLVFNLFSNFSKKKKTLSVYVKEKNYWKIFQWKKWRWKNATSAVLICWTCNLHSIKLSAQGRLIPTFKLIQPPKRECSCYFWSPVFKINFNFYLLTKMFVLVCGMYDFNFFFYVNFFIISC